ncbi:DNA-processing protein DprA [Alicyclobacillus sp.]|uniref:DNA-processing protein DprA n=1 Tax=Alicyclobacillus sp. TaxID=61169 RepID=UPI0025BB3BE5|nr:DNA-processing protein DprA [Alicyclobacillus sp.]MCL6515649.1 DNA-processing protein DprA [Alicyclobacillus sp.]
MEERGASILLAACPRLEPSSLRRLLRAFGSAEAVVHAAREGRLTGGGIRPATAAALAAWLERTQAKALEERLAHRGIRCLVRGDAAYPAPLEDLADPPTVLFVRGDLPRQWPRAVGIVGTRRATAYGLEATRWIAETLAGAGWVVVSGLAIGIDGQAHQTALERGRSVAVLGCGVDVCYPSQHRALYDRMCTTGAVLSEYPPGTPVAKHHFPERNRLIAALSEALVVVQAGDRSGALVTVDWALDLGRPVYVVPGPITSQLFRGSNRLLQQGAEPLVDPLDLLQALGGEAPPAAAQPVPERWRALYEALAEGGNAASLAAWLQMPIDWVYTGLLELELAGCIERQPGGGYRRAGARSSSAAP